jgi:hypothetical protein
MKKRKLPKVRNEFVVPMLKRGGSGSHGKSAKAKRQQDKMQLKQEVS